MFHLALLLLGTVIGCAAQTPVTTLKENRSGAIYFQSVTLPPAGNLFSSKNGTPVTLWAELNIPEKNTGRVPAVVLLHGCGGLGTSPRRWVDEFARIGVATLNIDSFSGRGLRETCTGKQTINLVSRVVDAYRARELLAADPRIDAGRIALMGFSQGARTVLYARNSRVRKLWMRANDEFAAYMAFYPGCNRQFIDEQEDSTKRLGIFHGTADDWTGIDACREYRDRMRQFGKDVELFEYPNAYHAFDVPTLPAKNWRAQVLNGSNCTYVEIDSGRFRVFHRDTGQRATADDPCTRRGATVGYNASAHRKAIEDVEQFLAATFAGRN